jgi:hypothetical protein
MVVYPSLYYTNCENFWGILKLRAETCKNKNYKLRLMAGSWGLIEALKT